MNAISGQSLRQIGAMTELRELWISTRRPPIPFGDENLSFLRQLSKLQSFTLSRPEQTDGWLVYLDGRTSLKFLQLFDMVVTEEGVGHLKTLPNLTAADSVYGTTIPLNSPNDLDGGEARLREASRCIRTILRK